MQRRFKAAFEAYKERELPSLRADVCIRHLRLATSTHCIPLAPWATSAAVSCQSIRVFPYSWSTDNLHLQEVLYKQFQKSPENPYDPSVCEPMHAIDAPRTVSIRSQLRMMPRRTRKSMHSRRSTLLSRTDSGLRDFATQRLAACDARGMIEIIPAAVL